MKIPEDKIYGVKGPLTLIKVKGGEFELGDIVYATNDILVIDRIASPGNYDCDDGSEDSPFRRRFDLKEDFIVYRAKNNEKN